MLQYLFSVLDTQYDMVEKVVEKQNEAISLFYAVAKYPRKKKKKIRKQCNKDYSFWLNMEQWYKKEFNISVR